MPTKILLSKPDAAGALGVSLRTIDYLITKKRLPVARIGRRVLIPREAVEKLARDMVFVAR
jgi:excisionase family DNA binding protein